MSVMNEKPAAIILAAGLSRRMGKNKLLMDFNGKPLVEHLLQSLPYHLFSTVIMVTAEDIFTALGEKYNDIKIIINTSPQRGQNFSIHLGLCSSPLSVGYCFFVADQPFICKKTIEALTYVFSKNPDRIIIPHIQNQNGNPVFFPACYRQELLELKGDSGGKTVIKNHPEAVLYVPCSDKKEFFDIDTPEEFALARKMIT